MTHDVLEMDPEERPERIRNLGDVAEQGTRGDKDEPKDGSRPPHVQREDERQSER